ncbi:MAG TPA: glycosyltransferase family 4 protein [Solirubrobacterales bacterium]|nr:glycosyltransferase family 4 protein [Solirubrobacterales bacterium]
MPEPGAPPEITLVANDIRAEGGMERQLTVLVGGLLDAGHKVTVIAWTCELPPHPNLRRLRVPGPSRPYALGYPLFLLLASALVTLRGRGEVHSTGAIVLNRTAVCTVHFCHHAPGASAVPRASRPTAAHRANAWVVRRLNLLAERWCYRPGRATRLVGVSGGIARELGEHFPRMRERIAVIPNGVDTAHFSPAPRPAPEPGEALRVLFVGGDWERKGLPILIAALAACPGAELDVVGAGDVEGHRRLARRHGVEARVHFRGTAADTAPAYRAADVFALPTAYESFSLVTYEAAASGLPLLATRVNGIEDLLRDGVNGWFVERSATDVAARLRTLRADPARRREMGAAARRDSLGFSWRRVVEAYRALYTEIEEERWTTRA